MKTAQTLKNYICESAAAVQKTDFEKLEKIAQMIAESKPRGARIFTAGNGGSSSTASHMVNDLTKGCRVGENPGFNAMCLSDSCAVVTCLANDFCYEDIYKIMLQTYAKSGDLLIVFSGSGNSENILRAVKEAKALGVSVIGFGGRDGGKMKELCDICIIAPTDSMEMLEDMHLIYEHALVVALRELLAETKL
jgi:D-sedoheptulose 7-phosphate isomerase